MDNELIQKAKDAIARKSVKAAPDIQYNLLVPVTQEQAEKILKILEEKE